MRPGGWAPAEGRSACQICWSPNAPTTSGDGSSATAGLPQVIRRERNAKVRCEDARLQKGEWRRIGEPSLCCTDCDAGLILYGQMTTIGSDLQNAALVCFGCAEAWHLDEFDDATQHDVREFIREERSRSSAATVTGAGVLCGNCKQHHANSGEVRRCYERQWARAVDAVDPEEEVPPLDPDRLWAALRIELGRELMAGLARMRDKDHAEVLQLRLGLSTQPPLRAAEVAKLVGCSPREVLRREGQGYPRLRRAIDATEEGRYMLRSMAVIIGTSTKGWDDRTMQLGALLLPDVPRRRARQLLLALVQAKLKPELQARLVDDERATQVSGPDVIGGSSDEPSAPTVDEAVLGRFGVSVVGGPPRFAKSGWFYVGQTVADCPSCRVVLEGFRCPYTTSAGIKYHYWALACLRCCRLWAPADLDDLQRKDLYGSSGHRPTA